MGLLKMPDNIMVIAAHPDDEVLGCAGTIAHHVAMGDHVHIVFMSNGVGSRNNTVSEQDVSIRQDSAKKVATLLGTKLPVFLDYPDNRMDSIDMLDITQAVEKIIQTKKPRVIYTHFPGDLNIDHCITHQAVLTACRPQKQSSVRAIYCFEVLSSTEWNSVSSRTFVPNVFVNITDHWDKKLQALECYAGEMRDSPHSRSINCVTALATLRGETHGCYYAEAFMLERMLVNGTSN